MESLKTQRITGDAGFTLIELSVVLVIIGLLAGSILVGRDLIHDAELRTLLRNSGEFGAAVNTFRDKYGCLPGDCATIGEVFQGNTTSGNGDGMIGTCNRDLSCLDPTVMPEYINFWHHLSLAGMVGQQFADFNSLAPETRDVAGRVTPRAGIAALWQPGGTSVGYPSGWAVKADVVVRYQNPPIRRAMHHFVLGINALPSAYPEGSALFGGELLSGQYASFSADDIYRIDAKIDDGMPLRGSMLAWSRTDDTVTDYNGVAVYVTMAGPAQLPAGTDVNACVLDSGDGTPLYNVTTAARAVCGAVLKAPF